MLSESIEENTKQCWKVIKTYTYSNFEARISKRLPNSYIIIVLDPGHAPNWTTYIMNALFTDFLSLFAHQR